MTTEVVAPPTHRAELPTTAAVIATTAFVLGPSWTLPAVLWTVGVGVRLAFIDAATLRLPNRLVAWLYAGILGFLGVAAVATGAWGAYLGALVGGAVMFAVYFLLAFIRPGSMGMGDVKLAAPLGTILGWFGWQIWFAGAALGFVVGAIIGVTLIVTSRADLHTKMPFGPAMLIGAWVAILLATI